MYNFVFASRTDSTGANAHQRYFVWVPWLHARSTPCDAVRHDNVCGFFHTCLHFCIFAHFSDHSTKPQIYKTMLWTTNIGLPFRASYSRHMPRVVLVPRSWLFRAKAPPSFLLICLLQRKKQGVNKEAKQMQRMTSIRKITR